MTRLAMLVLCTAALVFSIGCRGMSEGEVARNVELWRGAVEAARDAGFDADVTLHVSTKPLEFYAKQAFGADGPLDVSLTVTTNVKPRTAGDDQNSQD